MTIQRSCVAINNKLEFQWSMTHSSRMMLGSSEVSGRGSSNMYGLEALWRVEVSTGVFPSPGGDTRDSRSSEMKCRMSEGLGKSSFNFFSGSSRMLGMILFIDGREKTNLHLINRLIIIILFEIFYLSTNSWISIRLLIELIWNFSLVITSTILSIS